MKPTRRQTLSLLAAPALLGLTGLSLSSPANAQDLSGLLEPGPLGEHVLGDPKAPVTIIEYASMTCGHCRTFHKEHLPQIREKYIDTGKAKIYFREFPFDPASAAAFMLAQCSGEDKYFSMVDVLFEKQRVWTQAGKTVPELFNIAKAAGFTQESFEACLKDQELLENIQKIQKKAADEYGVQATPTFFINGERYAGVMTAEEMGKLIEDALS